jgi:hypothetical protein
MVDLNVPEGELFETVRILQPSILNLRRNLDLGTYWRITSRPTLGAGGVRFHQ